MPVELADEQRRQVLESRLTQFAFDRFGHTLNRQVALEHGDSEAVAKANDAIAIIDSAALVYESELASIPPPPTDPFGSSAE